MALRPPSNQKARDDFYSRDPAFVQPPTRGEDTTDAAWEIAVEEYETKLRVAHDTGDWSGLRIIGGPEPTKFVMGQVGSNAYRAIIDQVQSKKLGMSRASQIAFRASCQSIVNLGDHKVKCQTRHDDFGMLVDVETVDLLDSIDPGIVSELGLRVLERSRAPSPK